MGLYLANGTRVTQGTIATTADPDPLVTLDTDLYLHKRTGREDDKPQGELKTLFARAGKVLRQSQVNALFHAADVHGILPATGDAAGGTEVTISGNYLDGVTAVSFDGTPGTSLTVVSDREVKVTTPAHAAGAVNVVLTDDKGSTTVTNGFTYE